VRISLRGVHEPGSVGADENRGRTRREVLRDGTAVTMALFVAPAASSLGDVAVAVGSEPAFFTEREMHTLRGLVDRFIPGKPEDLDDGAVAAGCAEAIDALLGAFEFDPPRIYAGGPWSKRGGGERNHFKRFVRLDAYEEKAWRLRIEGSRGRKKLEFNGPVTGWQEIYRNGLSVLNGAARNGDFGSLSPLERDLILRTSTNPWVRELIDVAFPHTWQFMYGAPEYGGNRGLIGWRYSRWPGDVHPRGYTREEIEQPGPGGGIGGLLNIVKSILSLDELLALAPYAGGGESAFGLAARSESLRELREEVRPVLRRMREERNGG